MQDSNGKHVDFGTANATKTKPTATENKNGGGKTIIIGAKSADSGEIARTIENGRFMSVVRERKLLMRCTIAVDANGDPHVLKADDMTDEKVAALFTVIAQQLNNFLKKKNEQSDGEK